MPDLRVSVSPCLRGEEFVPKRTGRVVAAGQQVEQLGPADSILFGSGIEAHRSVMSAVCCFSLDPDRYDRAVARALSMGGDVDTVAAMTGALAGTHGGLAAVPSHLLARLEDGPRGRGYLTELARQLAGATG